MADTERLIHKRYQLQRMLTQGQVCTIYLAFDQVLQRAVVVKLVPAEQMSAYKNALRLTASFSHPNIIGTYDFLQESDMFYLVQEYVDGNNIGTLLQTQLAPYIVADMGTQICQALLYAGGGTHGVCHGDLTPSAIIRDHRGLVRINGFALPSNVPYFAAWSMVGGGNGNVLSNPELPWGRLSEQRRADDTRAVGLLLYQLLSGRQAGATSVDAPADGRLRFLRNVPVELCEIIARTIVRQHPQHISTPEVLHEELRKQVETLEPAPELSPSVAYQAEDNFRPRPFAPISNPGVGKLVTTLPLREGGQGGPSLAAFQSELNTSTDTLGQQTTQPPFPQTNTDNRLNPALAHSYNGYPISAPQPARRQDIAVWVILCLLAFVLFFIVGFFIANAIPR